MINFEKLDDNKVEFSFTISVEMFDTAVKVAYNQLGNKFTVPGFRKGKKPPIGLIESNYGKEVFTEDAFEIAFRYYYSMSLDLYKIVPITDKDPEIKVGYIGRDKPVEFSLVVSVDTEKTPQVELGDYKGVEVSKSAFAVTDVEIETELDSRKDTLVKDAVRRESVERSVEDGDILIIDYSGSVDEVKFDGGTAQNQELKIGSNSFIPGFEEQLIGMNINESKDITVKFPDEYHAPELAGKDAVFSVTLHTIYTEILPELDDEFISERTEYSTLVEYNEKVRAEVVEMLEKASVARMNSSVLKTAADNSKITLNDEFVEHEAREIAKSSLTRYGMNNISIEQFCQMTGSNVEEFMSQFRESARQSLAIELVLFNIALVEDIKVTQDDVEKFAADYVKNYYVDKQDDQEFIDGAIAAILNGEQADEMPYRLLCEKAQDLVLGAMKVID